MLPVALFAMSGTAGAQETVSVTVCLPPGKHWFFVAPQFLVNLECGAAYNAELTCSGDCIPPDPLD